MARFMDKTGSLRPRTKPHTGMLVHFDPDSVLTASVPAVLASRLSANANAAEVVATGQGKSSAGPLLDWPRKGPASIIEANGAEGNPGAPQPASASRNSRAPLPEVSVSRLSQRQPMGSVVQASRSQGSVLEGGPPGSRVSVSVTALGRVLDDLAESKDGLVSKADVFAALRAKQSAPRRDISQDITIAPSNVVASHPSSTVGKADGYQFKMRPSSAAAIRQRQRSSTGGMSSLSRASSVAKDPLEHTASEAHEVLSVFRDYGKLGLLKGSDEACNDFLLDQVPTPMKKLRARSRDHTSSKTALQRERSVPMAPSLLNLSRPYSGMRRTTCW